MSSENEWRHVFVDALLEALLLLLLLTGTNALFTSGTRKMSSVACESRLACFFCRLGFGCPLTFVGWRPALCARLARRRSAPSDDEYMSLGDADAAAVLVPLVMRVDGPLRSCSRRENSAAR